MKTSTKTRSLRSVERICDLKTLWQECDRRQLSGSLAEGISKLDSHNNDNQLQYL